MLAGAPIDPGAGESGITQALALVPPATIQQIVALGGGRISGSLSFALWSDGLSPEFTAEAALQGCVDPAIMAKFNVWNLRTVDLPGAYFVQTASLAAKLDAEDWRNLVNAYLDQASAAVTDFGGHVLKKLGDGLMALFGYPQARENDAERAVRAALAIQRALSELNFRNTGAGKPELVARTPSTSQKIRVETFEFDRLGRWIVASRARRSLCCDRLRQDRACARAEVADFGDLLAPHQDARHDRLG